MESRKACSLRLRCILTAAVLAVMVCAPACRHGTAPAAARSYTVGFRIAGNGAEEPKPQQVTEGGLAAEPAEITVPDGYVFDGWYEDKTFRTRWDFTKDKVFSNMTLYGFVGKDGTGGVDPDTQKYAVGDILYSNNKPVAVVFAVAIGGNSTDASPCRYSYTKGREGSHGKAVAITAVYDSNGYRWSLPNSMFYDKLLPVKTGLSEFDLEQSEENEAKWSEGRDVWDALAAADLSVLDLKNAYSAFEFAYRYDPAGSDELTWYLPSIYELKRMYEQRTMLAECGMAEFKNRRYWSASQSSGAANKAWAINMQTGSAEQVVKSTISNSENRITIRPITYF